jgi:hypothetical protein
MPAVVRYERQEPGELWILRSSGGLMALAISSVARAGSFLCAVISPVDAVPPYPAAPWRGCARTETGPVPGVPVDEARRPAAILPQCRRTALLPTPVGQGGTPDSASMVLMGLRRSLERLTDRQRLFDYTKRPLSGCYHPRRSSRAPARGKVRHHRSDQALQGEQAPAPPREGRPRGPARAHQFP